ncbi:hypothetical protein A3A54_02850 [Candidatus Curtissbacteria bacterium RIFCSPLOWO2_01_FULL_39_62]|uniref:Uncharacterized protein n=2 Tax=Candidatus Curtissiibacteriota TaxID=1752717 RepID=A0A1F5G6D7_9BACT|nr:MAG: hypothetical protein A3D04_00035 [Candidatus Curtissbacteria bacterium RIFCSPHIGHO2_02_FULL_40_16b]OGD90712.1 MAG: hypothetical protein A3E11_00760 [Candidatus Curtissbacteria bacterium RIFCSPHIGHO2_12_FULL_38_37]OGE00691.1 MAG: hypothetical protein A3J17_04010 [Candidatus Curtissbacteria bacterium RIFCSPLOWO2_02_FULL_40_11]OGE01009.1 MAG: hypothetical protein A3A54_02850 [Candidatus Curtissbacteria bacterium RIFCSPLOWO2_01_FULL_39_62]OGE12663.1 MAG: hypothetical protein A3G14_00295 [Ca
MQDLIKSLLEPLVENIKKVKIDETQEGSNIKYTIHIPKKDIAKVIGKEGRMIKSIKNLVKIRSIKEGSFTTIEVEEA